MRTAEMHCCRALLQPYTSVGAGVAQWLIFRYFLTKFFLSVFFSNFSGTYGNPRTDVPSIFVPRL
jgi:hypothetical protein